MIVTPEGLNVFPEDVERVLNRMPGVRESAVVGIANGAEERVHAVLVLEPGADTDEIVRSANSQLENHQQIRGASVWPGSELPRTEGARKLKRREIQRWVRSESAPAVKADGGLEKIFARFSKRQITPETTIQELGLSSLERVELMMMLEQQGDAPIDESSFTQARTIADLQRLSENPRATSEPLRFPAWNRSAPVRFIRRLSLPTWILPLARIFAHMRAQGREHLDAVPGPVIFAANHQSHFDVPAILMALPRRWRYRVATAMAKEFFHAHFFPALHSRMEWFTNSLNYYLACFFFNTFPIPQREAGARESLRYMGELASEGWSILIFPEGRRTDVGEIGAFQPGVGMIASRLGLPVVPVRLEGLDRVLHQTEKWPHFGKVTVRFGAALHLQGDDYATLAKTVESAVRAL
jgi:long-chain acyl-CoA synthetase